MQIIIILTMLIATITKMQQLFFKTFRKVPWLKGP